jgi:hypothetical protein
MEGGYRNGKPYAVAKIVRRNGKTYAVPHLILYTGIKLPVI